MASTEKDRAEIARIIEFLDAMLGEFDKAVVTAQALLQFTGVRSEERYLLILFGITDGCGQILDVAENNTVIALQEFISDPHEYRRMTSLLKDARYEIWITKGSQATFDVVNNGGHIGPFLKLAEDFLSA